MPGLEIPDGGSNELSRNEKFLQSIDSIIESNLSNDQFGVEQLAESLNISRTQLFRRLQKLKGKNISQYIREYRLQEAKELLKKDAGSASEISYRVGFSSPSYFNKCFHDYYGYTPGEVNKNHIAEEEIKREIPKKSLKMPIYYAIAGLILVITIFIMISPKFNNESVIISEKSLAILPFTNLSQNEEYQYYLDGIVEDLLTKLGYIKELRLISRTTSTLYRDTEKPIPIISKELNVSHIIEGSGRVIGNECRITVQLIDAKSDQHVWALDTTFVLENILTLQNSIATRIASQLVNSLSLEQKQILDESFTNNLEAYQHYLKSISHYSYDIEGIKKSIKELRSAVALDSNFDVAWAELSLKYIEKAVFRENIKSNLDSAMIASEKALEINPLNSTAYFAKANINYHTGEIEKIFANVSKAYELGATKYWMIYLLLSVEYKLQRNYEDAFIVLLNGLSRSLVYDSMSHYFYNHSTWTFIYAYDITTATEICKRGLELFPESIPLNNAMLTICVINKDLKSELKYSSFLYKNAPSGVLASKFAYSMSLFRNSKFKEAEELMDEIVNLGTEYSLIGRATDYKRTLYILGYIKIKQGKKKEGLDLIQKYIDLRSENKYLLCDLAKCYFLIGDTEKSLNCLMDSDLSVGTWLGQQDPILEEMRTCSEISYYIDQKMKEIDTEIYNAVLTFRNIYEKLITNGNLKRIENYL